MLYDEAIRKIEFYKDNREIPKNLMDASYSDWAIDEILTRLCEEVGNDPKLLYYEGAFTPKDVVEVFYLEMEYLEDTAETPRQRLIFRTAKREADAIIDLL